MSNMRKSIEITWPVIVIFASVLLIGAAIGVGLSAWVYHGKTKEAQARNAGLITANLNLQQIMTRMSLVQEASLEMVASPAPAPVQSLAENTVQKAPVELGRKLPNGVPSIAAKANAQPLQGSQSGRVAQAQPIQSAALPPTPTAAAPQNASAQNESPTSITVKSQTAQPGATPGATGVAPGGVSMEQAGVRALEMNSVHFKSGRIVSVGEQFPSGEKLLSVSPQEGKMVTDRRTIVLMKPQN